MSAKQRKKRAATKVTPQGEFAKALDHAGGAIAAGFKQGLTALGSHSTKVTHKTPRWITGSLNFEEAVRSDPRMKDRKLWDYAVGFKRTPKEERCVWVEVHSATTGNLPEVLQKHSDLEWFLKTHVPDLYKLTLLSDDPYVWITEGRVDIRVGAPKEKVLQLAGIRMMRTLHLPLP